MAEIAGNIAMKSILRALSWPSFSLAGLLLLLLPPGILPGAWSAPLESAAAWVWLTAWCVVCWLAGKKGLPRKSAWALMAILAVSKALLTATAPQTGVWARFRTSGLVSHSGRPLPPQIEEATPPRPRRESGWQLHRDAFIPPHFINDHRRFNYYETHALKRNALPYQFELQGSLLIPSGLTAIVAPLGGRLRVGRQTVQQPQGRPARIAVEGPAAEEVDYFTTATTAFAPGDWIGFEQSDRFVSAPDWRWQAMWPCSLSPGAARGSFFWGWLQNLGLWGLLILAAFDPCAEAWRRLRPMGAARWTLPLGLLLAAVIPVQRDLMFLFRARAGAMIALALVLLVIPLAFHWRKRPRDVIHAISLNGAGLALAGLCVVAWTLVGARFFDSRFPRGYAIFPSGNDSLRHYTYAREILMGDWLHRADAPFSRQPFIRWLLLLPLWAEGEGAAWGFDVHWTVFALTGCVLWRVLAAASTIRAWLLLAIWFLAFPFNDFKNWVPTLFPETWAVFFLVSAYAVLCGGANRNEPRAMRPAFAGALLGVATWTRNNLLTVFPFWLGLLAWPRAGQRYFRAAALPAAVFALATLGAVGLITLRNTLLAPQAPLSILMSPKDSSVALFQGFQLREIADEELKADPALSRLDPSLARFLAGIRRRPGYFLACQRDRILVLLGAPALCEEYLKERYPPFNAWHAFLWLLALGRILAQRGKAFGRRALLAWGVVVSQAGLLFFTGYIPSGYRILLPVYPFLLVLGLLPEESGFNREGGGIDES